MSNSWKPPPSLNRGEHGLEFFVLTNDLTTLEVKDVLGKMSLFRNLDNKATAQRKYVLQQRLFWSKSTKKRVLSKVLLIHTTQLLCYRLLSLWLWSMIHEINDFRNNFDGNNDF